MSSVHPASVPAEATADPPRGSRWDLVRGGFALLLVASLLVRLVVINEGYFLADDFMMTSRALEKPFSWDYLMRVHTGHFEPIGFAIIWVLARVAPLHWGANVAVLLLGQVWVAVMVWRLLVELFGRRPLVLVPFGVYCFSSATVAAFSWFSAWMIWAPLMGAMAGLLRQHARYVRTARPRHAVGAVAWLLVGMLSFEKVLLTLPYLIPYTLMLLPDRRLDLRGILTAVRRTALVWLLYAVTTVGFLAFYLHQAGASDTPASVRRPQLSELMDAVFRGIFQAFVPSALGGPWGWYPISPGNAITDSPRWLEVLWWVLFATLLVVGVAVRRRGWAAVVALATYVISSVVLLGITRVPVAGAVAGQETRYVTDAVIPLVVTLGALLMRLRGESTRWVHVPQWLGSVTGLRDRTVIAMAVSAAVLLLSVHAMAGYGEVQRANPYRPFVDRTRESVQSMPPGAQLYDTEMPVPLLGGLYREYNLTSRVLSPFMTPTQRRDAYTRTTYTRPYLLGKDGRLRPMGVEVVASAGSKPTDCGWAPTTGGVQIPLQNELIRYSWVARVDYLAASAATGSVRLSEGPGTRLDVQPGLHTVYVPVTGRGRELTVTLNDPGARVCIGRVEVGTPTAQAATGG